VRGEEGKKSNRKIKKRQGKTREGDETMGEAAATAVGWGGEPNRTERTTLVVSRVGGLVGGKMREGVEGGPREKNDDDDDRTELVKKEDEADEEEKGTENQRRRTTD